MFKSRLSRKGEALPSSGSQDNSQLQPVKLLNRATDVTMEAFMDCVCDNNYSSLIISGLPTADELAQAWADVFYEYTDLVENKDNKYRRLLEAEIKLEKIKIILAAGWVKQLSLYYSDEVASSLRTVGFSLSEYLSEDYEHDLARINAEIFSMRFNLRVKQAQFESLEEPKTSNEVVDRKSFFILFDRLNDLKKREAISEKSTVLQFAIALSRYNEAIDHNKKIANGRL